MPPIVQTLLLLRSRTDSLLIVTSWHNCLPLVLLSLTLQTLSPIQGLTIDFKSHKWLGNKRLKDGLLSCIHDWTLMIFGSPSLMHLPKDIGYKRLGNLNWAPCLWNFIHKDVYLVGLAIPAPYTTASASIHSPDLEGEEKAVIEAAMVLVQPQLNRRRRLHPCFQLSVWRNISFLAIFIRKTLWEQFPWKLFLSQQRDLF